MRHGCRLHGPESTRAGAVAIMIVLVIPGSVEVIVLTVLFGPRVVIGIFSDLLLIFNNSYHHCQ